MPEIYNSAGVRKATGAAGAAFSLAVPGTTGTAQVVFSNSNNMTFGLDPTGTRMTASFLNTLPNVALYDGANSITSGTARFTNANGVSFTFNGQTISGSVAAGATATGNVGGLSAPGGMITSGTAVFSNANGVSFNIAGQTVVANVAFLTVANSNGVTLGLDAGTLTASVNAGAGGPVAYEWPPKPYATAGIAAVTVLTTGATGGSTQSTGTFTLTPMWVPNGINATRILFAISQVTGAAGTGSVSKIHQMGIYSLNGGSAFSLISSFMNRVEISQNSITAITHRAYWGTNSTSNSTQTSGNITANFLTGRRALLMWTGGTAAPFSLTPGNYYLVDGCHIRSSSVNVMAAFTRCVMSDFSNSLFGMGETAIAGYGAAHWEGQFSTTTNVTAGMTGPMVPGSIHTSAFSTINGQQANPMILFAGKPA